MIPEVKDWQCPESRTEFMQLIDQAQVIIIIVHINYMVNMFSTWYIISTDEWSNHVVITNSKDTPYLTTMASYN